jgi:hypothetical protein
LGAALGIFGLLASKLPAEDGAASVSPQAVWTEVQWPFRMDEWGKGKAFRCKAADCGAEVNLYIRAKIGFCNCTTGVADDDELERLSDFLLVGNQLSAMGQGQPITVAHMKGRSRPYAIVTADRSDKSALSVAFNDRCDAIVATVITGHAKPTSIEPTVIAFLNGATVLRWAEVTLGL